MQKARIAKFLERGLASALAFADSIRLIAASARFSASPIGQLARLRRGVGLFLDSVQRGQDANPHSRAHVPLRDRLQLEVVRAEPSKRQQEL